MAIALDTTNVFSGTGSISWSHTCTGSNLILIVGVALQSGNTITSVKYNGVDMNQINTQNIGGTTFDLLRLYYLVAPATGANTVAITVSGGFCWGYSGSFTGVNQGSPINPVGGATTATGSATTLAANITTGVDQERLCGIVQTTTDNSVAFTSSDSTLVNNGNWGSFFYHTSNETPAGAKSATMNRVGAANYGINIVALAPAIDSSAAFLLNFV